MNNCFRSPIRQLPNKDRSGSVLTLVIMISALLTMIVVGSLRMTVYANRLTARSHRYHRRAP